MPEEQRPPTAKPIVYTRPKPGETREQFAERLERELREAAAEQKGLRG